ncbi:methionine/alanine import family NSS transporter small subunit [Nesterenkonia alba]
MGTAAIVMMIVALVTVWGGLIASMIHLWRHPEDASE